MTLNFDWFMLALWAVFVTAWAIDSHKRWVEVERQKREMKALIERLFK